MPLPMMNAYEIDEWHTMIDINIKGVLHGIAAALPFFEEKDKSTPSLLNYNFSYLFFTQIDAEPIPPVLSM